MRAVLHAIWDRMLLSLPVVVMGALALGTYWLVRSTPDTTPAQAEQPLGHEPDYFMREFQVKTFDVTGRIRTEVNGAMARHYPDTQWLEVEGIDIRSFDKEGRLTTASAAKGLTNDDNSEVQLVGRARIVREVPQAPLEPTPRVEFQGESLHAFLKTERVQSHLPVVLMRGDDRFSADTLDFDNVDQVLTLQGRVRGTLAPPPP